MIIVSSHFLCKGLFMCLVFVALLCRNFFQGQSPTFKDTVPNCASTQRRKSISTRQYQLLSYGPACPGFKACLFSTVQERGKQEKRKIPKLFIMSVEELFFTMYACSRPS